MLLISLIVALLIVGLILYIVPVPSGIQSLIIKVCTVVVVVVLVIWVCNMFGVPFVPKLNFG